MKTIYGDLTDVLFEETGVEATKIYTPTNKNWVEPFYVWSLEDDQLDKLNSIPDEQWKDEYGWFSSNNSLLSGELIEIELNSKPVFIHKDESNHYHSEEYLEELDEEDEEWSLEYPDLLELAEDYYGMSYSWNVVALATTLAEANGMTLIEFLEEFE